MSGVATADRPGAVTGAPTWRVTWPGIRTVAVLELRQRIRSTRWVTVLVLWTLVVAALTLVTRSAVRTATETDSGSAADQGHLVGTATFAVIVFVVLSLGGLVAPALSATSVNGDRTAGVLAILQTSLLSPAEIALGKLAAAWAAALALVVTAAPFLAWAFWESDAPVGRLVTTIGLLALTLGVVCAVGLGFSAVTARTSSSAVLTYLTVAFLGLGFPLMFALSIPLTTRLDDVVVAVPTDESSLGTPTPTLTCRTERQQTTRPHTEQTWWLLAPSPYVVVADAAPVPAADRRGSDPLSVIREGVREARLGPSDAPEPCFADEAAVLRQESDRARERDRAGKVWPYGLAADLAVGALAVAVAVRRLRMPMRRLPRGTRIA